MLLLALLHVHTTTLDGCGHTNTTALLLFGATLNLSFPGLEGVKTAFDAGKLTSACNQLATYYANSANAAWLRHAAPTRGYKLAGGYVDGVAYNDTYNFYGEKGKVPRNPDGALDWDFTGPVHDAEFMYALNRHAVWDTVLDAWLATGNPFYAATFDSRVADWAAHNLPITKVRRKTSWR